jgi:hypothetical protein
MAGDGTTVLSSYTYGDDNSRLIVDEGGLRTYYAWDGICGYTESGGSITPTWSKCYIYLGARLLSTVTPNGGGGETIQYHHPDRLGTRLVTRLTLTNGKIYLEIPALDIEAEVSDALGRQVRLKVDDHLVLQQLSLKDER